MDTEQIIRELQYKAVRSSGAGGQNVNKVSSKVVLYFDVPHSGALSKEEKALVKNKLGGRMNSHSILIINCDEDRSQLKNKEIATKRFLELIRNAITVQKPRKATKIPKVVIEKRIKEKRNQSETKSLRKKPDLN